MRILHLFAPAPFGGVERVVQSLATEQSRAGHDIHVAAILDPGMTDHPVLIALKQRGVSTHALTVGARAYRQERALVRSLCEQVSPDVVHTHGYRTDVLHSPVARARGIATVATAHGFVGGDWKNRVYEQLQRRAFRRCSATVAVSRPMRDGLIAWGIPAERVRWIPNAWADPIEFSDWREARQVLQLDQSAWAAGFIGRISMEKGPDTFVDAFARGPASAVPEARAVLIGAGRLRDELMQRVESLGIRDSFRWPGAIDNAGTLIRAFDVIVLSSRTEGTPMVLLEAIAAGVPVIATRVGGIPDVVSESEAILVAPNDPDALSEAMQRVMSHPEAAAARAERASARLTTEFSADLWRERYDEVYRSCVGTPPPVHA